jgi:hypothetical protein
MIRCILWTMLFILCLGAPSIYVRYTDGLEINLKGWRGPKETP